MATSTFPLTPELFETGLSWGSYLPLMKDHRETSATLYHDLRISPRVTERFESLAERHGGNLAVSAVTEQWCGDSAVTLPIVARLAEQVPQIRFRVLVGRQYPDLHAAYKADGYESIPVLSFFDSDWKELGRWMERPSSAHERVQNWIADRPRIAELYGREESEAKRELKEIFGGLVREMAHWYRGGLWDEMLEEIAEILE